MTICYFGSYNQSYARNRIIIKGLQKNDIKIIECRDSSPLPQKIIKLFIRHWRIRKDYDVMIVGFPGQGMTLLAKVLTRKPVVLDAFYSLYNTIVEDRKLHNKFSLVGIYNYLLDWLSIRAADRVLLDTQQHIDYFCSTFGTTAKKFTKVWIGADTDIFQPNYYAPTHDKLVVGFQGTFVPLQGVEYIIRAAALIENEDIEFLIVGIGQTLKQAKELAQNLKLAHVTFHEKRMPPDEVPLWVAKMDICLGIFGNTTKTKLVIPNKVYEYLAMEKPVITADTPAIRELFDETELMLVPTASPESIAQAIITLKENPILSQKIARQGYGKFSASAAPESIGKNLKSVLTCLIQP